MSESRRDSSCSQSRVLQLMSINPAAAQFSESAAITEAKSLPIAHDSSSSGMVKKTDSFAQLKEALQSPAVEDVLLISIGCGTNGVESSLKNKISDHDYYNLRAQICEQQFPTYIKLMAMAELRIRILLIDGNFEKRWEDGNTDVQFVERNHPISRIKTTDSSKYLYTFNESEDSTLQLFACDIPDAKSNPDFHPMLEDTIRRYLDKGAQVFIGDHIGLTALGACQDLGVLYNSIKDKMSKNPHPHSELFQLYHQVATHPTVRCFRNALYDSTHVHNSHGKYELEAHYKTDRDHVAPGMFRIFEDLTALRDVPEFQAKKAVVPKSADMDRPSSVSLKS